MITPVSQVYLFNVPLTVAQSNQFTFSSRKAQLEWFFNQDYLTGRNFTYQREDGIIRFEERYDTVERFNYCMYINPTENPQDEKWYFAFIEDVIYLNDEVTGIKVKTDVWQTYQFDFQFLNSYIEREHTNDDRIGVNTLPENLELGPYVVHNTVPLNIFDYDNLFYVLQVTDFPNNAEVTTTESDRIYNGMPSGCFFIGFRQNNASGLNKWIKKYSQEGQKDAIIALFPLPLELMRGGDVGPKLLPNNIDSGAYIIPSNNKFTYFDSGKTTVNRPRNLNGYTPKNNKLFTAPYTYFYFNNHAGALVEYNFENFSGDNAEFNVLGALSPGGEYKLNPINLFAGQGDYGYGVPLASLPQGSWSSDTYTNWLALNNDGLKIKAETANNQFALGVAGSLLNAFGNFRERNGGGALNTLSNFANNLIDYNATIKEIQNQKTVASKMPDQALGDTSTRTLAYSMKEADGAFYIMTIKYEYAKIIDNYFSMFGYQSNSLKRPNIYGRKNWNYVKSPMLNVKGKVPQSAIEELRGIFATGITFWHKPENFLNYDVDNSII